MLDAKQKKKVQSMKEKIKQAEDMILNHSDQWQQLLLKGLNFAPTPNWSELIENCKWKNIHLHIKRI